MRSCLTGLTGLRDGIGEAERRSTMSQLRTMDGVGPAVSSTVTEHEVAKGGYKGTSLTQKHLTVSDSSLFLCAPLF